MVIDDFYYYEEYEIIFLHETKMRKEKANKQKIKENLHEIYFLTNCKEENNK